MAKVCQSDFEKVRPTEYFPETFIEGECDACFEVTFVARVTRAEAAKAACACDPRTGIFVHAADNNGLCDGVVRA